MLDAGWQSQVEIAFVQRSFNRVMGGPQQYLAIGHGNTRKSPQKRQGAGQAAGISSLFLRRLSTKERRLRLFTACWSISVQNATK